MQYLCQYQSQCLAPGYSTSAGFGLLNLVWSKKGSLPSSPDFLSHTLSPKVLIACICECAPILKVFLLSRSISMMTRRGTVNARSPVSHSDGGSSYSRHRISTRMGCIARNFPCAGLEGVKSEPGEGRWSSPYLGRPSSPGLYADRER
ncbi:hypothetical protein B0T13DRAFT_95309 [Neurospora crassa]|nr:hypothetical protein B0T13DRAFT_95309 [Neurospora crassa]